MQDNFEALGALVEKARERKQLSREAFAERLGITDRHLFSIERENKTPSYRMLKKLIYALEIPPEEIFYPDKPSNAAEYAAIIRAISRLDAAELAIIKDLVDSLIRNRYNRP